MSCEFEHDVQAYHDGELAAARVQQIDAHLHAGCTSCDAGLKSLQLISQQFVADMPMKELPADARLRLHAAVDRAIEQYADYSLMPLARSLIGIAAAVLIVATAGLWYMPRNQQHVSAPQPWEGALLTSSQSQTIETPASSGTAIDPDVIVADLSRRSRP